MDKCTFTKWLSQLKWLTAAQQQQVQRELRLGEVTSTNSLIDRRGEELHSCPHCYSGSVVHWGFSCGLQRYRCRECHKTFNALTGTDLAHLRRRELWREYGNCLLRGTSIRQNAHEIGVSASTIFRWRHRWLHAIEPNADAELSGIIEMDETWFRRSYKGKRALNRAPHKRGMPTRQRGTGAEKVPVLIAEDRHGHHFDQVLTGVNYATLGQWIPQLIAPESVLCSDGAAVYRLICEENEIHHEVLNSARHERVRHQVFHIQHVNGYQSRLKNWLQHFKGVATQYLPHYLGWRRLLENKRVPRTPEQWLLQVLT